MERAMIEFTVNGRNSAVMESLKRARQKAGITSESIKATARKTQKTKIPNANKLRSDLRVTLARTEADIKQHTERKKKLEAELDEIRRSIGPFSMTATIKRQQICEEQQKISKLEDIRDRCRKELGAK